jgi:hypothetical protein
MADSFQIFPFKIEGFAETKPLTPSLPRRSPRPEPATQLAQLAIQLTQLANRLKRDPAQRLSSDELNQAATQLKGVGDQLSNLSAMLIWLEPPDQSPQLRRAQSEVSRIAEQLTQFAAEPSPAQLNVNVAADALYALANHLLWLAAWPARLKDEPADLPPDEKYVSDLNFHADQIAQELQRL